MRARRAPGNEEIDNDYSECSMLGSSNLFGLRNIVADKTLWANNLNSACYRFRICFDLKQRKFIVDKEMRTLKCLLLY